MPHHEHPELAVKELLEPHDAFGRWLAVAIVITTLAGALVAFGQANSVSRHDEAVSRAEQWATLASSVRSRSEQAAQLQIARARLVHQDRVRSEQAEARLLFAPGRDARALRIEAREWRRMAKRVAATSVALARSVGDEFADVDASSAEAFPNVDPRSGRDAPCARRAATVPLAPPALPAGADPDTDPELTNTYLAESRRESYRFDALRQGATREAETAEKQFTRYAVSLAWFAVAVFLFGYALTPFGHRYRRRYSALAAMFAIGSALWGVYSFMRGPAEPSHRAAAAYADGRAALDRSDFPAAISALDCAIELNEDFPTAYLARGEAYSLLGSPQQQDTILNEGLIDPDNLRRAREDAERAQEPTAEDPRLVMDLATETFVDGVTRSDRGELERALELHERSREMLRDNPVPAFNVGTTQIALGRPWQEAYDEAEGMMGDGWPQYVGAALTDLAYVSDELPRARRAAAAAKDDVVTAASLMSGTANGHAHEGMAAPPAAGLKDVELLVTPGAMELTFTTPPEFRPGRDRLFAAVYRKTARGWAALPSYSGPLAAIAALGGNRWFQDVSPLYPPTSCLPSGRYRAELFVDGRLAAGGTAEVAAAFPTLEHETLTDLNVDLCHPRRWKPVAHRMPGIADGFVAADGKTGVVVFDTTAAADSGIGVDGQLRLVQQRFGRMLPALGTRSRRPAAGYVMGLADGRWTWYRHGGDLLLMTTATTAQRAVVTAVFGPGDSFEPISSGEALSSVDLFFALTTRDAAS